MNLEWAANAIVQVANNPFAILALLLVVISSVAIAFFSLQGGQIGAKLTAFAILGLLFVLLMGFALKSAQSQASLESARTDQAKISAIQSSAERISSLLNGEISKRDVQIAHLRGVVGNSANAPSAAEAAREIQDSLQNSHCSAPISKIISVNATPGWKIVPDSVRIAVLFKTGNSQFEGPSTSDSSDPGQGFKVKLLAENSGTCGPRIFGQRVGLDGRGSIGVAIRYTEELKPG